MTKSTSKRLFLLRHALASWPSIGAKDFDRPLDPSGFAIIDDLAQAMARKSMIPEAILCSAALRTSQTLEHLQKHWNETPMIEFSDRLYSGSASDYLQAIRDFGYLFEECQSLMLIGHNPSIEDLTFALTGNQSGIAFERLRAGFPTAGLAVFDFDVPFTEIGPRNGQLMSFPTL
ncbi:SixA phosphatase family protein [Paenochrobactrum pullorum]|uniref:SixA phosphatase family protein n=1 Tax=Paenochrobactrum pullorum TaxID=1324351 RepID=UPI0035BC3E65